jgi:hypothetical protein
MRIEVVQLVPRGGDSLVTLDVKPEDEERAQLVERAKWRLLPKLVRMRQDTDLVMVVCDHRDEHGRKLIAALGLEVDRRALDEPAVGVAPAWLVAKTVGAPIPALPDRAFCLLIVTSESAFYTVKF